jgi:hypothetical protein
MQHVRQDDIIFGISVAKCTAWSQNRSAIPSRTPRGIVSLAGYRWLADGDLSAEPAAPAVVRSFSPSVSYALQCGRLQYIQSQVRSITQLCVRKMSLAQVAHAPRRRNGSRTLRFAPLRRAPTLRTCRSKWRHRVRIAVRRRFQFLRRSRHGFSGQRPICTRRQSWWIAIAFVNANYYHSVLPVWQAPYGHFCNKTSLLAGFSPGGRGAAHVGVRAG